MPRRGDNIYKRKDGRWEGRIKKADGKYMSFYAGTYKDVKEKKLLLLKEGAEADKETSAPETEKAAAQFERWLKNDAAGRVKQSTYENYYYCMKKYVIPFYEKSGNNFINGQNVSQFSKTLCSDERISQAYKKKLLSIFKTALKDILKDRPDYSSIIRNIKIPPQDNTEVQVFSTKEQSLIENSVLQSKDSRRLGILLSFYTGIRLGELCALKWGDIDFETGIMSVTRTVSRTERFDQGMEKTSLLVGFPKSQKSLRKIPVPGFLLDIVKERKLNGENDDSYILTGKDAPLDPRTYQRLFKKVLREAGVKERKFHAIRHTFATRALELGTDIKTLSDILGHSTATITLNIYTHSMFEQKKIAIARLNDMHVNNMETAVFAVTSTVKASV